MDRRNRLRRRLDGMAALGSVLVVTLFFLGLLNCGFVNWDDPEYVVNNPTIQRQMDGMFWKAVLTRPLQGHWHPVTLLSHALDWRVWGGRAWGHHLTSLLIHGTNTVLVFLLSLRLIRLAADREEVRPDSSGARWAGLVTALLFGLHPLRVEPVSWISARKELLAGMFYLASLLAYLRCAHIGGGRRRLAYAMTWVSFSLALLSKSMAVSLPFVLLILDYYPLRRFDRFQNLAGDRKELVIEKLPLFFLAAAVSLVSVLAMRSARVMGSLEQAGLVDRLSTGLWGYRFYLEKTLWPVDLAPYYPHPSLTGQDFSTFSVLASGLLLAAVTWGTIRMRKKMPWLPSVWIFYLLTLLPVIGFVRLGSQAAADRYTYLPVSGFFLLAGAGFSAGYRRIEGRAGRLSLVLSAAALILLLGRLTTLQINVWRDSLSLWSRQIDLYPTGAGGLPYFNRGMAFDALGDPERALVDFSRAIELDPRYADAYASRGILRADRGDFHQALADLNRSIQLSPESPRFLANRGALLHRMGRYTEAVADYRGALRLDPASALTHMNLSLSLEALGRTGEAGFHRDESRRLGLQADAAVSSE